MEDRRCKLGLQGRLELVRLIEAGVDAEGRRGGPQRGAGHGAPVVASLEGRPVAAERASRACLRTRSSRPRSCPWALGSEDEQAILDARAKTNWGPMRLTWLTGRHRSTIWKVPQAPRRQSPAPQPAPADHAAL